MDKSTGPARIEASKADGVEKETAAVSHFSSSSVRSWSVEPAPAVILEVDNTKSKSRRAHDGSYDYLL